MGVVIDRFCSANAPNLKANNLLADRSLVAPWSIDRPLDVFLVLDTDLFLLASFVPETSAELCPDVTDWVRGLLFNPTSFRCRAMLASLCGVGSFCMEEFKAKEPTLEPALKELCLDEQAVREAEDGILSCNGIFPSCPSSC